MKSILILSLLLSFESFAGTNSPQSKELKTFNSNFGYGFKYPDCWKVQIDDVDYDGRIEGSKMVAVVSQTGCQKADANFDSPRAVGFTAGYGAKKTKQQAIEEIEKIEAGAKTTVARQDWLVFKKFKAGPDDVIAWVEKFGDDKVRWQFRFYCKDWWIGVTSTGIRSPDKTYLEKFKNGDLALPEPEKTIIESLRCIPPRSK